MAELAPRRGSASKLMIVGLIAFIAGAISGAFAVHSVYLSALNGGASEALAIGQPTATPPTSPPP